jgi:NADH-quinone oxidoreductase subunit E
VLFRSFLNGANGVFIGGCHINDCHYNTEGNYDAFGMVQIVRELLHYIGVEPERLRLEWVSAGEGIRFAEIMNEYGREIESLGPIGHQGKKNADALKSGLEAILHLISYIKMVERERLRIPVRSEQEMGEFYASADFKRLLKELVIDKLEKSRIMSLLREKPRSSGEIAKILDLSASEVSQHINDLSRQGMTLFDEQHVVGPAFDDQETPITDEKIKMLHNTGLNNPVIDQLLDKHQGNPGALIHVLMEIQSENQWLPKEILDKISRKLEVPLSKVMQVATFYKTFSLTPKGRHEIHVCNGTSCHLRGAPQLLASLEDLIGIRTGETDAESRFSLSNGNCLGCCAIGPEIIVNGDHHGRITPATVKDTLKDYA